MTGLPARTILFIRQISTIFTAGTAPSRIAGVVADKFRARSAAPERCATRVRDTTDTSTPRVQHQPASVGWSNPMSCGGEIEPPEKNECGGYYCSPEHGHIDCNQRHRIMCPTCGEWFDCRSLDEVMFHTPTTNLSRTSSTPAQRESKGGDAHMTQCLCMIIILGLQMFGGTSTMRQIHSKGYNRSRGSHPV